LRAYCGLHPAGHVTGTPLLCRSIAVVVSDVASVPSLGNAGNPAARHRGDCGSADFALSTDAPQSACRRRGHTSSLLVDWSGRRCRPARAPLAQPV